MKTPSPWRTNWTYVLHGETHTGARIWPVDYSKENAIEATEMRILDDDHTDFEIAQILNTLTIKATKQ